MSMHICTYICINVYIGIAALQCNGGRTIDGCRGSSIWPRFKRSMYRYRTRYTCSSNKDGSGFRCGGGKAINAIHDMKVISITICQTDSGML